MPTGNPLQGINLDAIEHDTGCEHRMLPKGKPGGHEAYSCDLLETRGNPDWHFQQDVMEIIPRADQWGGVTVIRRGPPTLHELFIMVVVWAVGLLFFV